MIRSVDLKQLFKLYKQNSIMSFFKLIKKCFLGFSLNIWSYSFSVPVYFVKFIDAAGVRQMKDIAVPSFFFFFFFFFFFLLENHTLTYNS